MTEVPGPLEKLDFHMEQFVDREDAAMKAEGVDGEAIAAAMKALRSASSSAVPSSTYRLPIIPIFVGHGEAVKDVVSFAEWRYAVDFSHFDDLNPSQRRTIQNLFDYQISLIRVPVGCTPTATIVCATETILRKTPRTRILICSISDAAADKISSGFTTRQHLCDFRFRHLRFLPRTTDELQDVRVIICTYKTSGIDRLIQRWSPQLLISDDAGRLRHYELIVPISACLEV